MSILEKIIEDIEIPDDLLEDSFLESESEAESFFDLTPSCDFDVETSDPDYNKMDESIIPQIKTVENEEAPDACALAQEIEEEFLELLASPQTRDNILYLTGTRKSAKFRKDPHFAFRYAKALEYNPLLSLYPKLVLSLPYKEFNSDGENLNLSCPLNKVNNLIPANKKIDPQLSETSPLVSLLEQVTQKDSELRNTKNDLSVLYSDSELPLDEDFESDLLSIDQTDIQPIEPFGKTETPEEASKDVEEQFMDWLTKPGTRNMVWLFVSNKRFASQNPDIIQKYAKACRYNPALSLYPKMVKAFVHGEFHADEQGLHLDADTSKIMNLIKPTIKNLDFNLAKVSPIVKLLQSICDKWMAYKEDLEAKRATDVTYTDNAPSKGDLDLTGADVEDDLNLELPEEYKVDDKPPVYDTKDNVTDYNHTYNPGFVPPLENHEAQYVHVDNCDALGQQSITTNQSDTPILNKYQEERVPLTEKPFLPDGLGMPLYTVSSEKPDPHNLAENISLTDLANKTIANYLVENGISEPTQIFDRLRNEGMKTARISEIIGMVKYLKLK